MGIYHILPLLYCYTNVKIIIFPLYSVLKSPSYFVHNVRLPRHSDHYNEIIVHLHCYNAGNTVNLFMIRNSSMYNLNLFAYVSYFEFKGVNSIVYLGSWYLLTCEVKSVN